MANSGQDSDREKFYQRVRKRTVETWRKSYISNEREEEEAKRIVERLRTKPESAYSINNVLWVVASIGMFYFTDFALVVLYDTRINRRLLYSGAGCMSISVLSCLYCIVWLSWIKRIHSDKWEEQNIFVIPTATAAGIIGGALVCWALWPVWSVLTIPIVGIQFMGFIVVIAMVPDIL